MPRIPARTPALLLAILALGACSEEPVLVIGVEQPSLGQEIPLTYRPTDLVSGETVIFVAGNDEPGSTSLEIDGRAVEVEIFAAREVARTTASGDQVESRFTLPFSAEFDGTKLAVAALRVRGDDLVVSPIAKALKETSALLSVGPKQAILGRPLELSAKAAPSERDRELRIYRGEAVDDPQAGDLVEVGAGPLRLSLKNARLVGGRSMTAGLASLSDAPPTVEGDKVHYEAILLEGGLEIYRRSATSKPFESVPVHDPVAVTAFLLAILGVLFGINAHPRLGKIFKVLPLLVFAYFVPTVFSNLRIIPIDSPAYGFIKSWLLPASLVLLTLSVDIPAILRLGKVAISVFLFSTLTIVIGGPLAYLILHGIVPEEMGPETWKGLAALSGSWIGGTANMVAIGESVGVKASTFQMMIVVDVAVANVWMAFLLWFAGREKDMDEKIGADRGAIDEVRKKVEDFHEEVARPTKLADLLLIVAIALVTTALCRWASGFLPDVGDIVRGFTWIVIMVTTIGVGLSFTRFRDLEGAGAGAVGSTFLYLLVASIGAHAEFAQVLKAPAMVAIGAVWMLFHAVLLLLFRRFMKAPIFFAAVGSKANIGGAASAPIVASAFHPALAPVGILLAVGGYVLGTYAGLLCAFLLRMVHGLVS